MVERLGCPPDRYTATILFRPDLGSGAGDEQHPYARIRTGISQVTWSRDLDRVSEAQVVVGRQLIDAACDRALRRVTPWVHELRIYRAGASQPVWTGPVRLTERTRHTYVLHARDLAAWLEVRTNPESYEWTGVDLATAARRLVRMGLTGRGNPDPGFWPYARFDAVGVDTDVEQQRTYDTPILDELDRLCDQGMDYTVTGRRLWCFGEPTLADPAHGVLSHTDILDELSLVVDGDQTCTRWIVEGSGQDGQRVRSIEGDGSPWYGLIERSTRAEHAKTDRACTNVAQNRLRYSRNPPATVVVPDGAALSPQAPITIDQLVPGTRWDISLVDAFDDHTTPSKLTRVSVTAEAGTREQVAASFVPLGQPDGG